VRGRSCSGEVETALDGGIPRAATGRALCCAGEALEQMSLSPWSPSTTHSSHFPFSSKEMHRVFFNRVDSITLATMSKRIRI
jgi:hypothetical protein